MNSLTILIGCVLAAWSGLFVAVAIVSLIWSICYNAFTGGH